MNTPLSLFAYPISDFSPPKKRAKTKDVGRLGLVTDEFNNQAAMAIEGTP